jgi:hypothetical protein
MERKGAADKAESLAGCKSPYRQLPGLVGFAVPQYTGSFKFRPDAQKVLCELAQW